MSASPAGPPSGPNSTTPGGGPVPPIRRRKPGGIFAPKKSKQTTALRRPGQLPPNASNGATPSHSAASANATPALAADPDDDPALYQEYPLVTTKKALLEGIRYHALKFVANKPVDPWDEEQFVRPLRLQRRFPHDTPNEPRPVTDNPEDDKEREKEVIRKAERQAEREANQAQMAPTAKSDAKKRQPFKKKVEDVYYPTDTAEAQKRAKLRYEEGRPWHLEDFGKIDEETKQLKKNVWVGTYEAPLSESHAMFVPGSDGVFRMVPLEKWYRFAPTNRFSTMNLEQAESHMDRKAKDSRWFLEDNEKGAERRRKELERQRRLESGRVGMRGERKVKGEDDDDRMEMAEDADDIDFDLEDEFQDDDEDKLFGDDEDAKDTEKRLRQDRFDANIFAGTGVKEEKDWLAEEERERKQAAEERKKAKKLRKNLIKRERKFEYDSESDHPYSEESDSEDSEEERQHEEEERKKKEEEERKANGASGASTVGTNTPSGRPEKHSDAVRGKTSSSAASLKRPGSPNLSETSGSESTHKRPKKLHENGRPMSPALAGNAGARSPAGRHGKAGSGSDTEASGTERRNKVKLGKSAPGSPVNGTPTASRTGTPALPNTMPTAAEVRAAIPPEGIKIQALIAKFRPRVQHDHRSFIALVRSVSRHDKANALILPR